MLEETIQMHTANHSTTGNVNTTLQCNHCRLLFWQNVFFA